MSASITIFPGPVSNAITSSIPAFGGRSSEIRDAADILQNARSSRMRE